MTRPCNDWRPTGGRWKTGVARIATIASALLLALASGCAKVPPRQDGQVIPLDAGVMAQVADSAAEPVDVGAAAAGQVIAGDEADVVDAEEQPIAKSFRERTRYEMEQVLGQPLRLLQDAINAAYRAETWRWRTESTGEQDLRAYARARSWGFHIDAFVARGRERPFRLDDLAEGPLQSRRSQPRERALSRQLIQPPPEPVRPPDSAAPAPDSPESARRQFSPALTKIDAALDLIEHMVDTASNEIENSARRLRTVGRRKPIPREVIVELVASTAQILRNSEAALIAEERKIQALKRSSVRRD